MNQVNPMNQMNPIQIAESGLGDIQLNSIYEVESILLALEEIDNRVGFWKNLKKHRVQTIDAAISDYSGRAEKLRKLVLDTLKQFDEKTLDFPGIAKVTRRKNKDSWEIDDANQMLNFFKQEGLADEVSEVKTVVKKTAVNKLLLEYSKKNVNIPGTSRVAGAESISVTFEKTDKSTSKKVIKPKKSEPSQPLEELEV